MVYLYSTYGWYSICLHASGPETDTYRFFLIVTQMQRYMSDICLHVSGPETLLLIYRCICSNRDRLGFLKQRFRLFSEQC